MKQSQIFVSNEAFPGIELNNISYTTISTWDSHAILAIALNVFKPAQTAKLALSRGNSALQTATVHFSIRDCFKCLIGNLSLCNIAT